MKTSELITQFHQRLRATEFRQFLDAVDAAVPRHLDVHLSMDNYGTHEIPLIRKLAREAPARARPLHAHLRVLVEPRGALVCRAHEQTTTARRPSQHRSAAVGDSRVHRRASCQSETVCLDEECRRDPRQHCAHRPANTRFSRRATYCANHAVRTLGSTVTTSRPISPTTAWPTAIAEPSQRNCEARRSAGNRGIG